VARAQGKGYRAINIIMMIIIIIIIITIMSRFYSRKVPLLSNTDL
jgi:hypothetical protein